MTLDELETLAADLFPQAVIHAIHHPGKDNPALEQLEEPCRKLHSGLGFRCMADCFAAIAPHSEGELTLTSWSTAEIVIHPWKFRVRCRAFYISSFNVHFEIQHNGPLPGITETGYLSMFVPLATFADTTSEEFIRTGFAGLLPAAAQMSLI